MSQQQQSLENLAARIQRLEDIEAIKHLMIRYARASDDNHNVDIMVPQFAEDGILDVGSGYGQYQGHKALREFLQGPAGKVISWSLHYMITPLIEINEDGRTARGFWYLWEIANMPTGKTGKDEAVWIGGSYDIDFVKQDNGEWKFKKVALKMEIMSPYSEGWAKKPWHDFGRLETE